jgi:cytochrome c oxidase cbb3-type subunit III
MSESHEHDPVQGEIVHEYDGILEADNQLPRWWLAIFVVTVALGVGYWVANDSWHFMSSPRERYDAELARAAESGAVAVDDDLLVQLSQNDQVVSRGREAFEANCVACHGARAEGRIGPNLTDDRWLHGGAPNEIYRTIREGFTASGMPAWGAVLGERQVQSLSAYVLTLRNTNVPGRPPEGDPIAGPVSAAEVESR